MGRVMKSGKVVVVLRGRFAGRKAVIVKSFEDGSSSKKFSHALVIGINKYPRKVTRRMSDKKVELKSKIRPFMKLINYNHLMPTRYQVDLDLKKVQDEEKNVISVDENVLTEPAKKKTAAKAVKKVLEEGYLNQDKRKSSKASEGVEFFYKRLRF